MRGSCNNSPAPSLCVEDAYINVIRRLFKVWNSVCLKSKMND